MSKQRRDDLVKKLDPELITPLLAEKYLESVPDFQRKHDERQSDKIAFAITKNEWRMNGATIVFNEKGELIDGQHRCHAIVKAGKNVYSLVVRGVPADVQTFYTIGDEKPRKLNDFVRAKHVNNVSSVLNMYWNVKQGIWPPGHGARLEGSSRGGRAQIAPISDVLKVGKEHIPLIEDLCIDPLMKAGRILHSSSFCIFVVFYYSHIEPIKNIDRMAEFFARVADGLELTLNHPAYRLRQKFMSLSPGESISRETAMALILKALHLYLDNKDCGKLQFRIESEPFPELRTNEKK
jgi:hypothetical protein